jgi:hypothetical protein
MHNELGALHIVVEPAMRSKHKDAFLHIFLEEYHTLTLRLSGFPCDNPRR